MSTSRRPPNQPGELHATADDYSLPDVFWRAFVATGWNREPVVFRQPFSQALATAADVHEALLAHRGFSFQIDNANLQSGLARYCPRASDGSLAAYARRMRRATGGRPFGLTAANFHVPLGWTVWNRFRKFLSGLYRYSGVPSGYAEAVLFLGDYENSAQGPHRDEADVFCFVVHGRKRIRLWPADVFAGQPRLTRMSRREYAPHLARSFCLEGQPGDILYWPASFWHVGESSGGVDASISLALHDSASLSGRLKTVFGQLVDEAIVGTAERGSMRRAAAPDFAREVAVAHRVTRLAAPTRLRLNLLRRRLEANSAFGFTELLPLLAPPPLNRDQTVRVDPRTPIEHARLGRTMIVAVAGRSFVLPFSLKVRVLLDTLNAGAPHRVSDLMGTHRATARRTQRGSIEPHEMRRLLDLLASAGAFAPAHGGR